MRISIRILHSVIPRIPQSAIYRDDLSGEASWQLRGTRFFVVTVTNDDPPVVGAVFEASDGTRFIFRSAGTLHEADILETEPDGEMTVN